MKAPYTNFTDYDYRLMEMDLDLEGYDYMNMTSMPPLDYFGYGFDYNNIGNCSNFMDIFNGIQATARAERQEEVKKVKQ